MSDQEWQTSSFSMGAGNCLQVRRASFGAVSGIVVVRNSRDPEGSMVSFTPAEWGAFIQGAKAGEFDAPAG